MKNMNPPMHLYAAVVVASTSLVSAHIAFWTDAMWGFNQTGVNCPQEPLMNLNFDQWWFHGHLDYPPHPEDIMQIPAGGIAPSQLSCDKDATTYWTSGPGGDQMSKSQPDYPCPGQPTTEFHTNGIDDLGGCALAVAYKSDVNEVQPEDFAVFSVNQTCVWYMHTDFQVPANMPPCPNGKCICAWFWMHLPDSGSEQMYMNGFQCNFTNTIATNPVAPAQVPRRCGPEPATGNVWHYDNCTYGPQQPFYWLQNERNNMFEGYYDSPRYTDRYNFRDGAQNNIFVNSSSALPASVSNAASPSGVPTASGARSSIPTARSLLLDSDPAASNGTMPMPGPSHPPSKSSDSVMPSPTDASASDDEDIFCSGDMPGSSLPSSASGTGSPLPTATSNTLLSLDSDPAASNGTVPTGVPSSSSGTAKPGPSSSPTATDTTDPASQTSSSNAYEQHRHHWYHHYENLGHGRQEKRSFLGEINGDVRRAWGAHHRRSAGKRQA